MQTEEATQVARDQARELATTVKDTTKSVAEDAKSQAQSALHQVRADMKARADSEATKIAETLHQTSEQLHTVAGDGEQQGLVSSLAQEGARAVDNIAGRLDEGGVEAVLVDVRSFVRRSPDAFLLGAAVTGFVVGRAARNIVGEGVS